MLVVLSLILFGCDNGVSDDDGIAKDVSENTSWPMVVEGEYEYSNSSDHGGIDQNVFGSIGSSRDSYIMIHTLDSILVKGNVSDGDRVVATIRQSDIDSEFYEIISIEQR